MLPSGGQCTNGPRACVEACLERERQAAATEVRSRAWLIAQSIDAKDGAKRTVALPDKLPMIHGVQRFGSWSLVGPSVAHDALTLNTEMEFDRWVSITDVDVYVRGESCPRSPGS